ncbi:hypothetical protein Leryth_015706 [Lithospermum erythrorhizon]|nr:hypothetical protein Leryth_015706 [Lithospermum erythrorhizon]
MVPSAVLVRIANVLFVLETSLGLLSNSSEGNFEKQKTEDSKCEAKGTLLNDCGVVNLPTNDTSEDNGSDIIFIYSRFWEDYTRGTSIHFMFAVSLGICQKVEKKREKSAAFFKCNNLWGRENDLLDYLRSLQPEKVVELSEPTSAELKETIHSVVHGLLATLSPRMHSSTPNLSEDISSGTMSSGVEEDCSDLVEDTSLSFQPLISLTRDYLAPAVVLVYAFGALSQGARISFTIDSCNEDGGWGLHIEGHSTMFSTALTYICLRLLGEGPDGGENNACARGRKWILDHGSVTSIPSWGKTWLSILGVLDWSGSNPMPPEFWILPSFCPVNPAKVWCYCRMVYMPMSYLYGRKFVGPITPLILNLRDELLSQPYHEINWNEVRHFCAKDFIWDSLHKFAEPILTHENSRYITIGCVEKVLCMLACWVEDPNGDYFKKHLARIPDYYGLRRWNEDAWLMPLKMQSFGSQEWDTGFAVQALLSSDLIEEIGPVLRKGHEFIKNSQVKENPSGDFKGMYRHISKGSWTFSDQDHGWQVSDCTAEGLKCCLRLSTMPQEIVGEKLETNRMFDAVNIILSLQSKNGGLAAWEPAGTADWLDCLIQQNSLLTLLSSMRVWNALHQQLTP